ncbi:aldose 1-epimerase [Mangrovimonas sp. YM274]|uniref:aldose 1-epimerase n=1 Tax=Mangrovimonas sp. YM274 TaxID=3070660 RepID=UPI0027DE6BA0|nr:hypothetical protein [Mangrovimonas sp. YM274]WMI68558.1 hypothetical protein RBH95_15595 [Mangrovimonas sp. YM274]
MFTIEHISENATNVLEIRNAEKALLALVNLKTGGSLDVLQLEGTKIISNEGALPFASSVLFPFANRIAKGQYTFEGQTYQLKKGEVDPDNAIHGLIYDREFDIVNKEVTREKAMATLRYEQTTSQEGFPFLYAMELTYAVSNSELTLTVDVENIGTEAFPFTLGWHPYFESSNLGESQLLMDCQGKLKVDAFMIPVEKEALQLPSELQIGEQQFDDCFYLGATTVGFKTPDYHIAIATTSKENYLQVYTPPGRKAMAIEPQTGPANSFNSGMGLQTLQPQKRYNLSWTIQKIG